MAGSRCEDVNCGLGPLLVVLSLQEASSGALGFSVCDSSALRRSILKVSAPRDWTGSPDSMGSGDGSTGSLPLHSVGQASHQCQPGLQGREMGPHLSVGE